MNISGIKQIVYQAEKIGIRSLFVLIQFNIDWIVCAWPNIAVTHLLRDAKKFINDANFYGCDVKFNV
jgi:hypothetical protein